MADKKELDVRGKKIRMKEINGHEMFNLRDMAKQFGEGRADHKMYSWFKNKNTLDFLEAYEETYNPDSNTRQMTGIKNRALENQNALTVGDWCKETGTPFMKVEKGRYGGTWAVFHIAAEFMMWINAKFKVWLLNDYERMKKEELLQKLQSDKFFAQKNVDNLMESLRFEQDRLKNIDKETKKIK